MTANDKTKPFNIAEHVGRYSLTYEQWLDHALSDPEGYGMTKEQVVAERNHYYANKVSHAEWSVTDGVSYTSSKITLINTEQPKGTDNGTPQEA